jgi:GntR family transcriptional regulator
LWQQFSLNSEADSVDDSPPIPPTLKSSRQPLYTQAIAALQNLLEEGDFQQGDPLPSEDVLARQLGISRSTLREALGYLETHGLVTRRQGIGTFVGSPVKAGFMNGLERLESFQAQAAKAGMQVELSERQAALVAAAPEVAALLGLEAGAEVIQVQAVVALNGRRTAYLNTHILREYASLQELNEFHGTPIDYLARRLGHALTHTRTEILALKADERLAGKLSVPPGKALLHLRETYYAADGTLLGVSLNYFLTEQLRFHIMRRVPLSSKSA